MGNVALCAPIIICSSSTSVVKVLSSDGRLMIYTGEPVRAADIMLENPGQFLCQSSNLIVGQRIPGMCTEEELEKGQEYVLLPLEMLYSVLTDEELNCLKQTASKGLKQTNNFSKIFPDFCLFPSAASSETALEDSQVAGTSQSKQLGRYSRQRSWQPALETIAETPPHY